MDSHSFSRFHGASVSTKDARVHSMKNCLSVILAITTLVERALPEGHRERGPRLRAAACRLRALLDEELDGASPETAAPSRLGRACVERLVRSVSERLTDLAARAGVELLVECDGGEIICDEVALGEALFNLIANAIDATPAGHAVCVATRTTPSGDQCWIVRDVGLGIPPTLMAQLGHRVVSQKQGGTGLGLALARRVVSEHGGRMHIDSVVGSGTTVSILLPARRTEHVDA